MWHRSNVATWSESQGFYSRVESFVNRKLPDVVYICEHVLYLQQLGSIRCLKLTIQKMDHEDRRDKNTLMSLR